MTKSYLIFILCLLCVSLETFAQSTDKSIKIQAKIDGQVVKSEDIQIEIRVNEQKILPQIIGDEFSADSLGWINENKRDIVLLIKYKKYALKFIDLTKGHFQGRWTISIRTASYLDKSDLPNAENVDYAYTIEFMPKNGPGIGISNVKYRRLAASPSAVVANAHRDNTRAKVAAAVALYPREAKAAFKNLRALGAEAIPFILDTIKDNGPISKPLSINKIAQTNPFLISVIANIPDKQADTALIELLSSRDVIIRGKAAAALGIRKSNTAIPSLIELLNDSKVYLVYVVSRHQRGHGTSPTTEVKVLIRDVAVDALEEITGTVLAESDSKRVQAKAWLRWWKKQQKSSQSLITKS
jgi:hypothetical protein